MLPSAGDVNNQFPQSVVPNPVSTPNWGAHPFIEQLKGEKKFFIYRLTPSKRPGKLWDKQPLYKDPSNLMYAEEALRQLAALGAGHCLGYYFTEESKRFFYDIDGCRNPETGELSPRAMEAIALFQGAYMEVSVSGKGVHIVGSYRGERPAHGCRRDDLGLELYTADRGMAIGTPYENTGNANADFTEFLGYLIVTDFPPSTRTAVDLGWTTEPVTEWNPTTRDKEELLKLFLTAPVNLSAAEAFSKPEKPHAKVSNADLWYRNETALGARWPDHSSGRAYDPSGADAGLAQRLAYWFGNNCETIEEIMRRPDCLLVRDRWDEPRKDYGTYLRMTIQKAVAKQDRVLGDTRTAVGGPVASAGLPGANPVPLPPMVVAGMTPQEMTMSDTQEATALIVADRIKGKMLFDQSQGKWLYWDGTRWKRDPFHKAFNVVRHTVRELNYLQKASLASASFYESVERILQKADEFERTSDQFDQDNYLLNTPAGTIDLRTGTLRQHAPEDMITKCTEVGPDTGGGAAFQKFLSEITLGDRELIEFLQVSLGACLSGALGDHWMLFWAGATRAGKNTLGELVEEVMGDYAKTVVTSTLMAKQNVAHNEIANLQGIRLAISSEVSEGSHWDEELIKRLTGDRKASARFMYKDFFEFQITHKHLVYGNSRPRLRTADAAIRSRIKVVPFKASFVDREDKDLPRRLREERGHVLGWLLEGHSKWLGTGKNLPACKAVADESADYFAAQSTPKMWLDERCEILTIDERPIIHLPRVSDLYRDFSNWKKARGEQPTGQNSWQESEAMRGFEKPKSTRGTHYRGLRLLPLGAGDVPFPPSPTATDGFDELVARELAKLAKL